MKRASPYFSFAATVGLAVAGMLIGRTSPTYSARPSATATSHRRASGVQRRVQNPVPLQSEATGSFQLGRRGVYLLDQQG